MEKYKALKVHQSSIIRAGYSKYIHTVECHLAIKVNVDPYLLI